MKIKNVAKFLSLAIIICAAPPGNKNDATDVQVSQSADPVITADNDDFSRQLREGSDFLANHSESSQYRRDFDLNIERKDLKGRLLLKNNDLFFIPDNGDGAINVKRKGKVSVSIIFGDGISKNSDVEKIGYILVERIKPWLKENIKSENLREEISRAYFDFAVSAVGASNTGSKDNFNKIVVRNVKNSMIDKGIPLTTFATANLLERLGDAEDIKNYRSNKGLEALIKVIESVFWSSSDIRNNPEESVLARDLFFEYEMAKSIRLSKGHLDRHKPVYVIYHDLARKYENKFNRRISNFSFALASLANTYHSRFSSNLPGAGINITPDESFYINSLKYASNSNSLPAIDYEYESNKIAPTPVLHTDEAQSLLSADSLSEKDDQFWVEIGKTHIPSEHDPIISSSYTEVNTALETAFDQMPACKNEIIESTISSNSNASKVSGGVGSGFGLSVEAEYSTNKEQVIEKEIKTVVNGNCRTPNSSDPAQPKSLDISFEYDPRSRIYNTSPYYKIHEAQEYLNSGSHFSGWYREKYEKKIYENTERSKPNKAFGSWVGENEGGLSPIM